MSQATGSAVAQPRLSRDDVVRMGQGGGGGVWGFVPLAISCLKLSPGDQAMRFLLAANYAKLGLVTPARELLDELDAAVGPTDEVTALRQAIAPMPNDRVRLEDLRATLRDNAVALAERGWDWPGMWEQVRTLGSSPGFEVYRTSAGECVRRETGRKEWSLWGGLRAQAADLVRQGMPAGSASRERPMVLEGVDPPWLLRELWGAMPALADGYTPPIWVVCARGMDVLHGLMLADVRGVVLDERSRWFIGEDATRRLGRAFSAGSAYVCTGGVAVTSPTPVRCEPDVREVVSEAERAQSRAIEELSRSVRERYAGRDKAWWRHRYDGAGEQGGEPLRVLIPTTRYSTYIKHASADLAKAIESVGAQVRLVIEPDNCSRMTGLTHLRAIEEFEPDLIVSVNYTRATMNAQVSATTPIYPEGVPMATWVQDAMPHLFRETTGRAMGELDFLVGHLHADLFEKFSYPKERALWTPVLASGTKFHSGAVDGELKRKHACEIAMVTHHSQTPEQLLHTFLKQSEGNPAVQGMIRELAPKVLEACERCWEIDTPTAIDHAIDGLMASRGCGQDVSLRAILANQVARPLADRAIRHQTLAWAAEVAERRGWRLHVYGKGWSSHPTLGKHAQGELTHDEELRVAYQCAGVQLHASINWYLHQRVLECALSGGLPAVRLKRSDVATLEMYTQLKVSCEAPPWASTLDRQTAMLVADHPMAMRLTGLQQRLGIAVSGGIWWKPELTRDPLVFAGLIQTPEDAAWLLGDPEESCFWSSPMLESLVERAIERPAWRQSMSGGIAGRVRASLSLEQLASKLVRMVRESLGVAEVAVQSGR